ncbi:MAG: TetR/AcrR family transcriptional regulator [Cyanobacteria bacterium P01_A01_bin.123]
MGKITKAEQTTRTRRAILNQARRCFATQGYAATGTESMIADLGITRGALYHQFGDKQGVFRVVIEETFIEIAQHIETQAQKYETPWDQLVQGSHAFLDIVQREDIRRLVLIEAPAVLDAETLATFDRQYGYGSLLSAIQAVVDAGELTISDVEGFAMMMNGALEHLAVWIAQAESPTRLQTAKALVDRFLILHREGSISLQSSFAVEES